VAAGSLKPSGRFTLEKGCSLKLSEDLGQRPPTRRRFRSRDRPDRAGNTSLWQTGAVSSGLIVALALAGILVLLVLTSVRVVREYAVVGCLLVADHREPAPTPTPSGVLAAARLPSTASPMPLPSWSGIEPRPLASSLPESRHACAEAVSVKSLTRTPVWLLGPRVWCGLEESSLRLRSVTPGAVQSPEASKIVVCDRQRPCSGTSACADTRRRNRLSSMHERRYFGCTNGVRVA